VLDSPLSAEAQLLHCLRNPRGLAQDYKSPRPVIIHYPPSTYLDDSTRRSVIGDLPGLRLPKDIILVQDNIMGETPRMFPMQGSRLALRLHNKVRVKRVVHISLSKRV
jgi:hypothetical protein